MTFRTGDILDLFNDTESKNRIAVAAVNTVSVEAKSVVFKAAGALVIPTVIIFVSGRARIKARTDRRLKQSHFRQSGCSRAGARRE